MTLDEIRIKIDAIDSRMKILFEERVECAKHVAEVKAETGGDVFVPERESEIIEKLASDVDARIYEEYVAFLRQLMSICRRYEYSLLTDMQDKVLTDAWGAVSADAEQAHRQVEVAFCCSSTNSNLNLFVDMIKLNQVDIQSMNLETQGDRQKIRMVLRGNIREKNMRTLLCQMGKEAEGFRIVGLGI